MDYQDYAPEINDTPSNLASHSIFDKAQNKTLNKTKHLMKMGRAQLWKNPFTKLQRIEMERHLMRIATQLELYRMKEGDYPNHLTQLPVAVEADFFSGEALRYKLKDDGTPHLWSIGPDQIDDGGLPSQLENHHTRSDLVWMLTPIAGLSQRDWRRVLREK